MVNNNQKINELQQGMVFLNNRKKNLDKVKGQLKLIEAFDTKRLDNVNEKEIGVLKSLEDRFDKALSDYGLEYKTFMDNYHRGVESVRQCKADCLNAYTSSQDNYTFLRKSCQAGCDFKGPYVSPCKDSFGTSRINSKKCNEITNGRCLNGNIVLGQEEIVNGLEYADHKNVTMGEGCCDCGGGYGGRPKSNYRGKNLRTCDEVPEALGFQKYQADLLKTACVQARVTNSQINSTLYQSYNTLKSKNLELINLAQEIFDKIQQMRGVNDNININMSEQDKELENSLNLYGNIYADILQNQGKQDRTITGQLEDIQLKEASQSMHFVIWGGLAVLVVLMAVQRMSQ